MKTISLSRYILAPCAGVILAAGWVLLAPAVNPLARAQAPASQQTNTREDFDRLFKEVSNWGRWGKNDQMGAVNLITPAKRKQAVASVKEGVSVSLARNAETQPAVDNPQPIIHEMGGGGRGGPNAKKGPTPPAAKKAPSDVSSVVDTFFIAYHGYAHTHMDSLCHFFYKGQMYNGFSRDEVNDKGANKNDILNFKNGILTHGVLMDIPRLKGVDYLEPGTRIYPEDLDAWVKKAHLKVEPGDVVIVRTGRWARRDAKGPWPVSEGLAGLYMTCARWLHQHDVAILGGDGAQDVLPSGIEGISQPIHVLVLVAMGMPIFDNVDPEALSKECAKRNRWDFLITAAPAAVPTATGSVLNPIATF
jgi:kynurenine formamidase